MRVARKPVHLPGWRLLLQDWTTLLASKSSRTNAYAGSPSIPKAQAASGFELPRLHGCLVPRATLASLAPRNLLWLGVLRLHIFFHTPAPPHLHAPPAPAHDPGIVAGIVAGCASEARFVLHVLCLQVSTSVIQHCGFNSRARNQAHDGHVEVVGQQGRPPQLETV